MTEREQVFEHKAETISDEVGTSQAAVDGRGICNPWDLNTTGVEVYPETNEELVPYSVDMMLSLFLVAS
jgi:hypothetical protein